MSNLILLTIAYPLIFTLYTLLKHAAFGDQSRMFHLTIPDDLVGSYKLKQIRNETKRRFQLYLGIVILLLFVFLQIPSFWRTTIMLVTWILLTVLLFLYAYNKSYINLRELITINYLKKQNIPLDDQVRCKRIPLTSIFIFVGGLVISFLLMLMDFSNHSIEETRSLLINDLVMFFFRFVIFLGATRLYTRSPRMISIDQKVNRKFEELYRNTWNMCFLFCSVMNTALSIVLYCFHNYFSTRYGILFLCSFFYLILYFLVPIYSIHSLSRIEYDWIIKKGLVPPEIRDDVHWTMGLFYNNPENRRLFPVPKDEKHHVVNVGSKRGILMSFIAHTVLISCIFYSLLTSFWSFVPIQLKLDKNQLTFTQITELYSLPLDSLEEVQLLVNLPAELKTKEKNKVIKGNLLTQEYGRCRFYLQTDSKYYMYLKTDNISYIVNGSNDDATVSIYRTLKKKAASHATA